MNFGPVFWIDAPEFDPIEYFSKRSDAENYASVNYEPFVTSLWETETEAEDAFRAAISQQARGKTVGSYNSEGWHNILDSDPLYKGAKQFHHDYADSTAEDKRYEFISKLATGQFEYLGIDDPISWQTVVDTVRNWYEDFVRTNGKVDVGVFKEINNTTREMFGKYGIGVD
jgi:hypothetical protein